MALSANPRNTTDKNRITENGKRKEKSKKQVIHATFLFKHIFDFKPYDIPKKQPIQFQQSKRLKQYL